MDDVLVARRTGGGDPTEVLREFTECPCVLQYGCGHGRARLLIHVVDQTVDHDLLKLVRLVRPPE